MFWRAVYRFSTVGEGKRHLSGGILIIVGQSGNTVGREAELDPEEMGEGREMIFFFFLEYGGIVLCQNQNKLHH